MPLPNSTRNNSAEPLLHGASLCNAATLAHFAKPVPYTTLLCRHLTKTGATLPLPYVAAPLQNKTTLTDAAHYFTSAEPDTTIPQHCCTSLCRDSTLLHHAKTLPYITSLYRDPTLQDYTLPSLSVTVLCRRKTSPDFALALPYSTGQYHACTARYHTAPKLCLTLPILYVT